MTRNTKKPPLVNPTQFLDTVRSMVDMKTSVLQDQIDKLRAETKGAPVDPLALTAAPTEDELVGMWVNDQRSAGATTVDLKQVDDIRTGIRYALNGGD